MSTKNVKRFRKVYYGHYTCGLNKAYPVIRMGGKYLAKLNFEIGDTIEVCYEPGRITIAKVCSEVGNENKKPDT